MKRILSLLTVLLLLGALLTACQMPDEAVEVHLPPTHDTETVMKTAASSTVYKTAEWVLSRDGKYFYDRYSDGTVVIVDKGFASAHDLVIPNTIDGYLVTGIADEAFVGYAGWDGMHNECELSGSLTLPASLESIGEMAFWFSGITEVHIPACVSDIGAGAFSACENLTKITVDPNNRYYTSVDYVLFSKDKTFLHTYPAGSDAHAYSTPYGVLEIGAQAFENSNALQYVGFKPDVLSIDTRAFADCSNLSFTHLPYTLKWIEEQAFLRCPNLRVEVPASVSYIGEGAFGYTDYEDLWIGVYKDSLAHSYVVEAGFQYFFLD